MKKTFKGVLSVVLCLMMVFSTFASFGIGASAAAVKQSGETIDIGSYPQSRVTDKDTISKLDKVEKKWASYSYDTSSSQTQDSWRDGKMTKSDYMQYADFTVDGAKYRAVKFNYYRPFYVGYLANAGYERTYQNKNGYKASTVYYFKFDPIKWRIIDTTTGLVITDNVIDAQPYNDFVEKAEKVWFRERSHDVLYFGDKSHNTLANEYETSSIRSWLINDFWKTAFSDAEVERIKVSLYEENNYNTLVNSGLLDPIRDNVFLMSNTEMTYYGSLLATANSLVTKGTAYSKCQGLWGSEDDGHKDYPYWRLRTPRGDTGELSVGAFFVSDMGVVTDNSDVDFSCGGIRPAMRMRVCDHDYEWVVALKPTRDTEGREVQKCKICGAEAESRYIDRIDPPSAHSRIMIKNNPDSKSRSIRYYKAIKLTATTEYFPNNARIAWYVNGSLKQVGEKNQATSIFTSDRLLVDSLIEVKVIDENDNVLHNKDGNYIMDTENIVVRKNIITILISLITRFLPSIPLSQ